MSTENQRWMAALESHAGEHAAMRERGLGRVSGLGRVRIHSVFAPAQRTRSAFMKRRGIKGLGGFTDPSQIMSGANILLIVLGSAALGAGALWLAWPELKSRGIVRR